jgi:two-component system chemotaxis sensor kinase CheA
MTEAQWETYREEAYELLAELEITLIALEEAPKDRELIDRVFRTLHTIKGSGAMFGFDDVAALAHEVETAFELVRNDQLAATKFLVDLTLAAGDQIRSMIDPSQGSTGSNPERVGEIVESFKQLKQTITKKSEPTARVRQSAPLPTESAGNELTYRIFLKLDRNIFYTGTNPVLLLNELRQLGECAVIAHTEAIADLDQFNPEECSTSWDIILTTRRGIEAIRDVFVFVEDACELQIDVIAEGEILDTEMKYKRLGEILIERGLLSREDMEEILTKQKRIGELLLDAGLVEPSRVESALVEQEHVKAVRVKQRKEELSSTVRVPAEKLDSLVNLVGELVTVQARLSQTVALMEHGDLLSISEEVERLTNELRDNAMSIRMLPIGTTFSKFRRLVRDLANELGKDIMIVTEGGETELDKTVIERLNDPLVHLVRNCIDHGIEPPEVRQAAGKPRQGTIYLSAIHSGANVLINIADDGAGLNVDVIRAKALERGLITGDAELSPKEIFALIFAPGFSTARRITNVSGRGVGLDVVKRNIDALRGSIEVSSHAGAGTTITLKLPLTLAIIDGLLVKVGDGFYVLPLAIVEECVELTREDVARAHGRHIIHVREEIVPYVRLRERFVIGGEVPDTEQIVITEFSEGKVGVVVDKVIGEHQTVIKNMGRIYRSVDVISGATILGDGTVALIMDVPKLVHGVEREEALAY